MIWCAYNKNGFSCPFRIEGCTSMEQADAVHKMLFTRPDESRDCPGDLYDSMVEDREWEEAFGIAKKANRAAQEERAVWIKLHPPTHKESVASETISEVSIAAAYAQIIYWQQKLIAFGFALDGMDQRGTVSKAPFLDAAVGAIRGWIYENIQEQTLQLLTAGVLSARGRLLAIPVAQRLIRGQLNRQADWWSRHGRGVTSPEHEKWVWNGWEDALNRELEFAKRQYQEAVDAVAAEARSTRK